MKSLLSEEVVAASAVPSAPGPHREVPKHARPKAHVDDESSSSSDDDRRLRRGSVKLIALDPVPAPHEFRAWVQAMYVKVCAASKRTKVRTLRWIKEVEIACAITSLETCPAK